MKVYTAQYRYSGEDRLDITVKSGHGAFCPTWKMVWGLLARMLEEFFGAGYGGEIEI